MHVNEKPATRVGASTPPGGVLRVGHATGIDTLDPHTTTSQVFNIYQYPIYDRLFFIDAVGDVTPMLAQRYAFSADDSTMEVLLRDDVVFHDGTPLTAAAVTASIRRAKSVPGSTVAGVLAGVADVEVVDERTVRFTLAGAGAELPAILATNAGAILNANMLDDPSVDLATAPPPGAGSGPYVVTASVPNVSTSYAGAAEYWSAQAERLAELTITYVADGHERLAGFRTGEFDMAVITAEVLEEARQLAGGGSFFLDEDPGAGAARDLMFNVEAADLADLDVRRAIAMAVDRGRLADVYPCVEHTQTQFESYWAYNPAIENPPYDPDAARAIVQSRGGVRFEVLVLRDSSFEQMARAVRDQLAEVGIDMAIKPLPFGEVQQRLARGEFQAVLQQMNQGVDPVDTINRYFLGGYRLARGPFAERLAAAIAPGRDTSLPKAERAPIYRDAFALIADEHVFIPLCRAGFGYAYLTPIVGFDEMPGVGGIQFCGMRAAGAQ